MAGRRPKPTRLKLLQGNPGGRPLNDREPQPELKKPRAPRHLDEEAKREWRRMSDKLYQMGLLTEIDKTALALYCTAWSRWVEAEESIKKYGLVMLSPEKGWPIQSPYLSIANKAMEQMTKVLGEFGMTPSSRTRVQVTEAPTYDPIAEWERGRRNG